MKPYQIFASMAPERAEAFFRKLGEDQPAMLQQAAAAAAAALKSRPSYVLKLPIEKQAATIRRALARVASSAVAEELLALYFLECRKALLVEWLELMGIEHEEGILKEESPREPAEDELKKSVESFCAVADDADRALLLQAFAAQTSIDWPKLEALTDPPS